MAKKKTVEAPPPAAGPARPNGLVIRSGPEWREWLKELAEHDRAGSVANCIDRATAAYARQVGFKKGAPPR
jgi:hypothetical protein